MYKLELTADEMIYIRMSLDSNPKTPEEKEFLNRLHEKLWNAKFHIPSHNKKLATEKATKVRSDRAKEKIQNAINLLQLENKAITHYSIAKTAEVSYNTVKKYIPDIDKIGKL